MLGPVYKERGLPKQVGCPSKWVTHKFLFFSSSGLEGKEARITWVARLPYLYAKVTLASRLIFFSCKHTR